MSTFSRNVTQKILGGGSFRNTTAGGLVAAGADEYIKVRLAVSVKNTGAGTQTCDVLVGANIIRSLVTVNNNDFKTFSAGENKIFTAATEENEFAEVIVPPNTTLSLQFTNSPIVVATGTYVRFKNTP